MLWRYQHHFTLYLSLLSRQTILIMKWTVVSKSAKQEVYHLVNKDNIVLTLEFHPFTNAARIKTTGEKRVFQIRKEGFLRNKTVLRNEYGVRIGQLDYEKSNSNEGNIELNDEKFSYSVQNNSQSEILIYRENKEEPLAVCGLKTDEGKHSIKPKNKLSPSQHFLLMSLCWYLFLPVAKKNVAESYAL